MLRTGNFCQKSRDIYLQKPGTEKRVLKNIELFNIFTVHTESMKFSAFDYLLYSEKIF